mmetsp:Transcript_31492/g.48209  ORF Transcript_31492/g.48209 Transcript_31492/m.48209 type:complete len:186 (+) Transcript_31492:53-610(+)
MEQWLFQPLYLKSFARDPKTLQPIPDELLNQLYEEHTLKEAMLLAQRAFCGQLEVELLSSFDPRGDESIVALQKRIAEKYIPHDMPSKRDISPLLQVFEEAAKGEDGTRYRYMFSEMMAVDVFDAFMEAGIHNEEELKRLGGLFRKCFLEPGGSSNPAETFREFRGRDPSVEHLLKKFPAGSSMA